MGVHKSVVDLQRRNEVITMAFMQAAHLLSLQPKEITQITGISLASWTRVCHHKRMINVNSKEAEAILLFLRIYRSLDALFGGNNERSREWLRAYNYHLNGIPLVLLEKIEGLVQVTTYLDAMCGMA